MLLAGALSLFGAGVVAAQAVSASTLSQTTQPSEYKVHLATFRELERVMNRERRNGWAISSVLTNPDGSFVVIVAR
jgi:hypothetical protein